MPDLYFISGHSLLKFFSHEFHEIAQIYNQKNKININFLLFKNKFV